MKKVKNWKGEMSLFGKIPICDAEPPKYSGDRKNYKKMQDKGQSCKKMQE